MKKHACSSAKERPDVVKNEIRRLTKQLETAQRKRQRWKDQCSSRDARLREVESILEQERKNAAQCELMTKIRTRLDDLAFYRGDTREGS